MLLVAPELLEFVLLADASWRLVRAAVGPSGSRGSVAQQPSQPQGLDLRAAEAQMELEDGTRNLDPYRGLEHPPLTARAERNERPAARRAGHSRTPAPAHRKGFGFRVEYPRSKMQQLRVRMGQGTGKGEGDDRW